MKKAWQWDRELLLSAVPKVIPPDEIYEYEDPAKANSNTEDGGWETIKLYWKSNVPGSKAPERVLVAGISAMYNMGYDVLEAEKLIPLAIEAREREDKIELTKLTARVFHIINNAKKIEGHPYWNYKIYNSFEEYEQSVDFEEYGEYKTDRDEFERIIYAGWMSQIIGGALGTGIEGYTGQKLREVYGNINHYVKRPTTYNDDLTFEMVFLEAFIEKGYDLTSADVAEAWVSLVPHGWSAEDIALRNIRYGIYPPESGYHCNPWREWIGAQMRGAICGMLAPGNPRQAAKLAWTDGQVSHHNNGIIGEVFNAILVSLSFVEKDVKDILEKTILMIPKDSEYYQVIDFAYQTCLNNDNWETAWAICEEKFKEYNWIHAYPNAASEVVSLYYCDNNFDKCLNICAMNGMDVDCNAGQIGTIFGIMYGLESIDEKWTKPIGDRLISHVRGLEVTSISLLAKKTAQAYFDAIDKTKNR